MNNHIQISFEKASLKHKDIIFAWLSEPHMQKFWDNSQEHKDDILNFIHGRQQHYFYGTTQYWVGYIDSQPFSFILSDQLLSSQNLSDIHRKYLSKAGHTIGLDFGIGHTAFLGKGFAAPTLEAFVEFYQNNIDPKADTFFIDPDKNNPRAIHVYKKAGFKMVGNFIPTEGAFKEQSSYLMVKQISSRLPSTQPRKSEGIDIEEINQDQAETLCRNITQDLPEYFGISSANEQYFKGIRSCKNLAAKVDNQYVGLLSLNFPYANNSNIYWMAILRDHQTKGIGRKLVEEACRFSRKLNATTMTVETLSPEESDENYLKTYQFYESSGFKPLINLKPEGYEWKMVYMVKQLDNALNDLLSLEKDARTFGFEWPNEAMIIQQAIDECKEIKEAVEKQEKRERIQEEIGDLLHSAVSLCDFTGFDVEETLAKVNIKFGKRMQAIKQLTHELGLPNLKGQTFEFMLDLWRKAKAMADKEKLI